MAISTSVPETASQFVELLDCVKRGEEVTIFEAGVAITLWALRYRSLDSST